MQSFPNNTAEARWTGAREVLEMSGPIILGSLSYTLMEFCDKAMVAQLGTDPLAATGSAALWSYTLATAFIGVVGCVSTFAAQSLGRGHQEHCARYAWQGVYLSLLAAIVALALWPLSGPLFHAMRHSAPVTDLELSYFRIRLFGYAAIAWGTALAAFFQAINRSMIPTYAAVVANITNLGLNYVLIFGKLGFPALGVTGAAIATIISQWVQTLLLQVIFLAPRFDREYHTRSTWQVDMTRIRELLRIGLPNAASMFLDIANWAIFTSFLVGGFGAASLAAHNIAVSFMHLSFMPAMALNQGIAPIVGQWIGRGNPDRAQQRTHTALRLAAAYMFCMGLVFAVFGGRLIDWVFSDDPQVIWLGHQMLLLAAIFQGFDALSIVSMGALRGAGDTRWMMWTMFFGAYCIFLPAATVLAIPLHGGAVGAWIGATIYIILLAGMMFFRFRSGRWREINIFGEPPARADGDSS
ncbi:MAG: MATE family efflux transporter [Candidatus Hydrogenedentes bacterium]|nr:MATE family efflux transporter [Candidatus Hydrogenedentota bacterium]